MINLQRIKNHPLIDKSYFLISITSFALYQLVEILFITYKGYSLSQLCNWDCAWYYSIVENGYDAYPHKHQKGDAANWAFFPVFPYIAKLASLPTFLSSYQALIISSKLIFLLSIWAFIHFVKAYRPDVSPWISALAICIQPYAIYASTGYSESTFLLFSCLFFLALKKNHLIASGFIAALLTATRLVGIVVLLSFLIKKNKQLAKLNLETILALLLIPLGLVLFSLYLYQLTGDALAFKHIQTAWNREPSNPLPIIWNGLQSGSLTHTYWATLSIAALYVSFYFRRENFELSVFIFFCTLIPLSTGLWAMPRYIFWQAPILLFLAILHNDKTARCALLTH